jgi:hypothetical protein
VCRYVKSKPRPWFVSRLVLTESGTQSCQRLLVAEQQAELIESMKMRIARALQFEQTMNGLLIPEARHNYEALGRMLVDHFRVLQEMGVEPKQGSMVPTAAPAADTGTERMLVQRIVDLPSDEFLELMHKHFADRRAKAPLLPGEVIDVEARVTKAAPAD